MGNPIEALRALEVSAMNGTQVIDVQANAEAAFADALRRVGSELLALWEAVERDTPAEYVLSPWTREALADLNARAQEVLHG